MRGETARVDFYRHIISHCRGAGKLRIIRNAYISVRNSELIIHLTQCRSERSEEPRISEVETLTALARGASVATLRESRLSA